jgi:hypothetical protein
MLSKLRTSIAAIYAWRLSPNAPAEYQPKTDAARQRLAQQADLAFRQAFALCPYSPEAVFRYVGFLVDSHRIEDARLIAQAAVGLARKNYSSKEQFQDLVQRLQRMGQYQDLLQRLQR